MKNLSAYFGKGKSKAKADNAPESASEDDENDDEEEKKTSKNNNIKTNLNKSITNKPSENKTTGVNINEKNIAKSTPKSTKSNKSNENNKKIDDLFATKINKNNGKSNNLDSSNANVDDFKLDQIDINVNEFENSNKRKFDDFNKESKAYKETEEINAKKSIVIKLSKKNPQTKEKDNKQINIQDSFNLDTIGIGRKRNFSTAFKAVDVEIEKKVISKKVKK
jgi:hypothetical protein